MKTGELKRIGPAGLRAIHWIGGRQTYLATAAVTGGAFSMWIEEPPAGRGAPAHVHTREEEFFYVLDGNFTFWCSDHSFPAAPGAFIGLPKGLGHQWRSEGSAPSRTLIFLIPGGGEGFFFYLGNPYSEPQDATVPMDPKRVAEASAKYGQTVIAPSLLHPVPGPTDANLPLGVGRAPTFREPGQGEAFTAGGVLFTLKTVGSQTLGAYTLTEIEVAAGSAFPAHRHALYTEGIYVLEGQVSVHADGPPVMASAGSLVIVPPGAAHTLANSGERPARLLSLTTPAGIENFYRSACRPVSARPAHPSTDPADADRLTELGPQLGVEFL